MSDETWLTKLTEEPLLLKVPLVRNGNQLTVGLDEATWKSWTTK
jgi:arsenate reductase-like glutaredoxin family protein